MAWPEVAKEILVTAAAVTGALVAVSGLTTWRRQLIGNKEYDAALAVLRATYSLRDSIAVVRNPFMEAGEMAAAAKELGVELKYDPLDGASQADAMGAAYQIRWGSITDALSALDVARVEGEALWGPQIRELVTAVRKPLGTLRWAVQAYLRDLRRNRPLDDEELHDRIHETLFSQGDGDSYSAEVEDGVRAIENFIRPKLGKR